MSEGNTRNGMSKQYVLFIFEEGVKNLIEHNVNGKNVSSNPSLPWDTITRVIKLHLVHHKQFNVY